MNNKLLVALLKAEVLPTMGCTEPGAVALAAAYASEVLEGRFEHIEVSVNSNVYKNAVAVGIPGTDETGLEIAVALGGIKRHPENQLAVLTEIDARDLARAKAMILDGRVSVKVDESKNSLWIEVLMTAGIECSRVVIQDEHTNVVSIQKNGEYIYNQQGENRTPTMDARLVLRDQGIRVAGIVQMVEALPYDDLKFLLDGVKMNRIAANLGITKRLGMGIGAGLADMVHTGVLSDDIVNYAKILTAAAADARMSGENVRVMSSAGSGNHGITAILPVYAVAKRRKASQECLARALAISHLLTIYVKIHTGNLSALCGCAVAAATGASAAITWMMGGDSKAIESAMKNVIGNLTGMICDGGKVGCALKLSTAAATAVESSLLAQRHIVVPNTNGIIENTIENTIRNLGEVSNPGMLHTDKVIMKVMLERAHHASAS